MFTPRRLSTALALTLLPALAFAAPPEGWHDSLEDGLEAARKSGKPVLLITAWKRTL